MGEDVFTPNSLELFIELIVVELTLEEQSLQENWSLATTQSHR
jgi:hypothetical protein